MFGALVLGGLACARPVGTPVAAERALVGRPSPEQAPEQAAAPAPPNEGAPEPALAEPEMPRPSGAASAPAVLQDEPPAEPVLLYAFVDHCADSRADSVSTALAKCRRNKKHGHKWQRRRCDCRRALVIEVHDSDPIAYYKQEGCWLEVGTHDQVSQRLWF